MANGDRTRRRQDDEQPGLFDHIVAADLEGIDPPSVDGVPEYHVHEPAAPAPGQTLAAWGDEDPTLTAPRVVEPTDAWESIEPKEEATIEAPAAEPTAETPVEAVVEAEAPSRDWIEPESLVEPRSTEPVVVGPDMDQAEVVEPASIDEPQPIAEVTEEPALAEVIEDVAVAEVAAAVEEPAVAQDVAVVEAAVVAEEPTVVEDVTVIEDVAAVDEPAVTEPLAAVEAHVSEPAAMPFKRVEPVEPAGREPVIALHGMPSRRSESTKAEGAIDSTEPRRAVAEPAPVAQPLPKHGPWAWLELTRISNVLTVATNALVGLWIAHLLAGQATIEGFLAWMPRHVGIVAGTCLLYLFGMVLNDLLDRDLDAGERPTRPLPSGRVALRPAILLAATLVSTGVWLVGGGSFPIPGLAAIAVGLAFGSFAKGKRNAIQWLGEAWAVVGVGAILWNWLDHWRHAELRTPWGFEAVLLLVGSIVAYSLVHRSWRGSVVLLGLCRALAYWCATLSVMNVSGMQYNGSSASAWGLVLFPGLIAMASTIAVSLMARDEAAATDASQPSAPKPTRIWVRVLLVAAVLVPWAFSPVVAGGARGMLQVMTIVALPMALFCAGIFLVKGLHAERAMRSHPTRIAGGVAAWLAAFCLLDASTLSVLGAPGLSVVALGCWWVTRAAQRRVAGS
jgi:4-hydroxybenzoate polyprenyltransferase